MKAILRSFSGFTREIPGIHPPPPNHFIMAVSENGAQIWNPHGLTTGEWGLFKQAKFVKTVALQDEDAWIYQQEMVPAIVEAVSSKNTFYEMMKAKQSNKPKEFQMTDDEATKLVAALQMTDDEATKLVALHRQAYKYDDKVAGQMCAIGATLSAEDDEDVYDFFTRLYYLATGKSDKAAALQAKVDREMVAEYVKKELEELKKVAAARKQVYEQQLQQYMVSSTQYQPQYAVYTNVVANQANQAFVGAVVELAPPPPKVEPEPKKPLPDPVEPKRRFMKKDHSS